MLDTGKRKLNDNKHKPTNNPRKNIPIQGFKKNGMAI